MLLQPRSEYEEFLGVMVPPGLPGAGLEAVNIKESDVPSTIDWRSKGFVSPVGDQVTSQSPSLSSY